MSRTEIEESPRPPRRTRLLIVSGRDPSGAGIDADLAAASEPWIEAIPIVTAETDQDAKGVRSIGARDPKVWLSEALEAARRSASTRAGGSDRRGGPSAAGTPNGPGGAAGGRGSSGPGGADGARGSSGVGGTDGDCGVDAIKFGLLPGSDHVRAARDLVRELRRAAGREIPAVVDPVIAASSGGRFLDRAGVESLRRDLVPCGVVLTPNLPETAEIVSAPLIRLITAPDTRLAAARELLALGAVGVVIKGGHGEEDPVQDLVAEPERPARWLDHPRIPATIRGSGCRFATRLAAELGRGASLAEAAEEAGRAVAGEIARAAGKGLGSPLRTG